MLDVWVGSNKVRFWLLRDFAALKADATTSSAMSCTMGPWMLGLRACRCHAMVALILLLFCKDETTGLQDSKTHLPTPSNAHYDY